MHALDTSNAAPEAANPPKDRIVSGDPQAVVRLGYASPDGKFSAGTWTCTPGRWRVQYDEVEYCRILSGKGAVIDADGRAHPIKPGDTVRMNLKFADGSTLATNFVARPANAVDAGN